MEINEFKKSLIHAQPSESLTVQQQALWWDAKGNWKKAHDLIDHLEDPISAHVHAYLHRVEGDLWNARYWYNKAKKSEFKDSLEKEWNTLIELYL